MKTISKTLILSCSTGLGHVRAGEALLSYFKENFPTASAAHFNITDYGDFFLKTSTSTAYNALITYYPPLFARLFRFTDTPRGRSVVKKAIPVLHHSMRKLIAAIRAFAPDRIITTHFLVPYLLEKEHFSCPIDVVVTDYYANLIWIGPGIRHLFVPTSEVARELTNLHPSIIVSGIPLHPSFYHEEKPLHNDLFTAKTPTILVLAGGNGYLNTASITRKLLIQKGPYAVIAIAGTNQKLATTLQSLKSSEHSYHALGFTPDIAELMRRSACVITKPGGLTVSEALQLKKPLVLAHPIPGQEEYNARFVLNQKYGVSAEDPADIARLARDIIAKEIVLTQAPTMPIPQEIIFGSDNKFTMQPSTKSNKKYP